MHQQDKTNNLISEYISKFSSIIKSFPIEEDVLLNHHKKIVKELFSSDSDTSSVKPQLENEFSKLKEQNVSCYQLSLNSYLTASFKSIDENVRNGNYKEVSLYKEAIDSYIFQTKAKAPKGPNREVLIYQFILNQLMLHSEMLFTNSMEEYENLLTTNKEELDTMTKNIRATKDEYAQIRNDIEEKAKILKQLENEKTEMLKKSSKESESFTKLIKEKSNEITRLNEQIERLEKKNALSLNDMKTKVALAEGISQEKERKANEIQSEAAKQKIILVNKIQLLEKNIKDLNEQRNADMKSFKRDIASSSSSSSALTAIEKHEAQIKTLNSKILSIQEKTIDLESLLITTDKRLENEKEKCEEMVADYERKLSELKNIREAIEEETKNIEENQLESEQLMKMEFEQHLSELRSTKSKNEVIFKENEQNLINMLSKTNIELEKLREEGSIAKRRLEEMKSQICNDKVEYDNYIKILEENQKRFLSQYEESVRENNLLKTQQEDSLLQINAENEKKNIALNKQNETLKSDLEMKKNDYLFQTQTLNDKIKEIESQFPLLKVKEEELNATFTQLTHERNEIDTKHNEMVSQCDIDFQTEFERVKAQCKENIETNVKVNEKNIIDINEYCEIEKEELLNKQKEEEEMNAKREAEAIEIYKEKIKILEEIKDEKIEELTQNISEAETNHHAYTEEVEEDLKVKTEQIDMINEELNETTINLNTIQSTHETVMKTNYENFKQEKTELEAKIKEYYALNKESAITISIITINNNHMQSQIDILLSKYDHLKTMMEEQKAKNEVIISTLNNDISTVNHELIFAKSEFEKNIALRQQEIDYINNQVIDYQNELEEFKATFEEKIAQCKEETRNEYSQKLLAIQVAKTEIEESLLVKQKRFEDLQLEYHNTTAMLTKEKEVLMEKLNNVTNQTKELSENLIKEREENEIKISTLQAEYKAKNNQIAKENEVILQKLKKIQIDYNELSNMYDKDSSLWNNKFVHLEDQKNQAIYELEELKKRYNYNVDDFQKKVLEERKSLEKLYRDAISQREEDFNGKVNIANKLFAEKFEEVNRQNQTLTIENKKLIQKLEKYEHESSIKDMEKKYTLICESESRLRIDYETVSNQRDKEIDALNKELFSERKSFESTMIELDIKLREYEGKRNSLVVNIVKQKAVNDKDQDGQTTLIDRLNEKIASLEKMNMRLTTENKEAIRDNDIMKKKINGSHNSVSGAYMPKYRMTSGNKENSRAASNIPVDHLDMLNWNKKNLLAKFNQKEDDKSIGSANNSIITNE